MRLFTDPKKLMVLFLAVLFFIPITSSAAGLLESAGMEPEKIELIVGKSLIMKLEPPSRTKTEYPSAPMKLQTSKFSPPTKFTSKGSPSERPT